jgi:hypothetical protein
VHSPIYFSLSDIFRGLLHHFVQLRLDLLAIALFLAPNGAPDQDMNALSPGYQLETPRRDFHQFAVERRIFAV